MSDSAVKDDFTKYLEGMNCQSIELPGPERIHANSKHPQLLEYADENVRTLADIILQGQNRSGDKPFLGTRAGPDADYVWMTYNEVNRKSFAIGCGLKKLGYEKQALIGICAKNRPEWVLIDHATHAFSFILVPLYETLGKEGMTFILKQTAMEMVFCDMQKVEVILDRSETLKQIKYIVTFGKVTNEDIINRATAVNITLLTFEELEEIGRANPTEKELPKPEDMALLCYTSGTTGDPKGVMLSHNNFISVLSSLTSFIQDEGIRLDTLVYMSYLPLAHMYERFAQYLVTSVGGRIGFFRGNISELVSDVQALRPTMFAAVPRVLNSLYDKVMNEVNSSWIKSTIFNFALQRKMEQLERGIIRKDTIWDRLIFHKIQAILGGRVEFISTGSAPISSKVLTFLRCALGCKVYEGYGQTETTSFTSITSSFDKVSGHVGPPATCCHVKLIDVPDMDYLASKGQGEICVKGPCVMMGYYKSPEKTKETFTEDGWLLSGDIGEWLPNGTLKIIDRRKHIFKLCQGEYVSPEKVEIVYSQCPFVTQSFMTGNSLESCVVGIVVPDEQYLTSWAKKNNISGSFKELCRNKVVKETILQSLTELGQAAGLASFEQVKAIHIHPDVFTPDNGLVTPTLKSRRPALKKFFDEEIINMYAQYKVERKPKKSIF